MYGIFIKRVHDLFKLPFQNKSLPSVEGFDSPEGKVFFWGISDLGFNSLEGKATGIKIRGKVSEVFSVMTSVCELKDIAPVDFKTACSAADSEY